MKFSSSVAITFLVKVLLLPISILSSIVTAKALGPSGKGLFTYVTLIPSFLVLWGSLGFGAGLNYLIASKKSNVTDIYFTSSVISILLGLIYAFISYGLYILHLLPDNLNDPFLITCVAVSLPPFFFIFIQSRLFQATSSFYRMNLFNLIFATIPLLFLVFLVVILNLGIRGAFFSFVASNYSIAILVLFLSYPKGVVSQKFNRVFVSDAFKYGIKSSIGDIALRANFRFDQLILGSAASSNQLGYYSIAVNFSEILWYIADSVGTILYPKVSDKNKKDAIVITNQVARTLVFISLMFGIILCIAGKPFILILYGRDFLPSIPLIYTLIIASFGYIYAKVFSTFLNGIGHPGWGSAGQTIGASVGAVLYFLIIPKYGAMGAAVASVISYSVTSFCLWIFYRFETKSKLKEVLWITKRDLTSLYVELISLVKQFHSYIGKEA